MRGVSIIVILMIIVVGAAFALLNAQSVTVNYFLGQKAMPLALLLVIVFAVGLLLGAGLMSLKFFRLSWSNRRLQRKVKKAEKKASRNA